MIIAVDGPAAAGKGTLAKRLAEHFNLVFLDTGLLYRAVARVMLDANANLADEKLAQEAAKKVNLEMLNDSRLRDRFAGEAASLVSVIPSVRKALLDFQRCIARSDQGAVLDGRDIGTVIIPEADVKFFVTASPEKRADRRYQELCARGEEVTFESILDDVLKRDERDMNRVEAPLKPAADAVIIDTSELNPEQVFTLALNIIQKKEI